MREEEVVTGIVLYATDLKEYDKRLVLLTKEHGKVTVFANGARRPNSRLRAACRSFCMGSFTVYAGRDSYTLNKAEISEYFEAMSQDIEKMCYASYFCELMSYYTREGDFCTDHLNLLYSSFRALEKAEMPYGLIRNTFELRLMGLEGEAIHAFSCVRCGKKEDLKFLSVKAGGLLCEDCAKKEADAVSISQTLAYTLRFVLTERMDKLFSFRLTAEAEKEFAGLMRDFMKCYVDREFKSLDILKGLL